MPRLIKSIEPQVKSLDLRGKLIWDYQYGELFLEYDYAGDRWSVSIQEALEHFEDKVVRFKISDDDWQ